MPPKHDFKFKVVARGKNNRAESWDIIYGGRSIGIVKWHPHQEDKFTLAKYGGTFDSKLGAAQWLLLYLRG